MQLQPGTYQVQPASVAGHIYLACSARTTPFNISLASCNLLFMVRAMDPPLLMVVALQKNLHHNTMTACSLILGCCGLCKRILVLQNGTIGGIVLDTCRRVTLQGPATLTYPWAQYPYAQGTILSVSSNYLSYTAQVCMLACCIQTERPS